MRNLHSLDAKVARRDMSQKVLMILHPFCLLWWRPKNVDIPRPPNGHV